MENSPPPKVFVSYAHKDGGDLARRLHGDLSRQGWDVWMDSVRLAGGTSWTVELERALDCSDVVLALLSRGSYLSDTCRAEQLRSLRKGKCVIPILAQADADRPLHLEARQYRDFSSDADYPDALSNLVNDMCRRDGAVLETRYRQTYITAPPLPSNYIERPRELEALRNAVVGDGSNRRIALTALKGMAGIGKTVLAQALCFDEVTQAAFPDGIVWLAVGKDPRDLLPLFREAAKAIGDSLEGYDSLQAASNRLRNYIRDKAALIVLDDVWDPHDAAPFLVDSPRSRLMITTRDARTAVALGAQQQELSVLTWEQSLRLLSLWASCVLPELPPEAAEIIRECASLPLAIAMVGAQLRGKPDRWKNVLQKLRNADLDRIRQSFPDYPHPDLLRAVEVSTEALDAGLRQRYLDFAVFPEDSAIPEAAVQALWMLDRYETEDGVDELVDLSLVTRDADRRLRVHDLLLDYLRRRLGIERLVEKHNELLRSYAGRCANHWPEGPNDGYFFENLIWHLRNAQRGAEAVRLLLDLEWMEAKLSACGVVSLLTDYEWCASRDEDTRLAQEALQLSAYVLAADPSQLAGQLLGRLRTGKSAACDSVRTQAGTRLGAAWLRPQRQLLTAPGGALMFTLASHTAAVRSVALTPRGDLAVSASADHTIKVWDLRRGTVQRTLTGHSDCVRAVAVLQDGDRVVSASDDHTLRVWDLSSGREEARIDTQMDWIRGLAALAGSAQVASISDDRTIRIWNLATRKVEGVLRGHGGEINCLAVMPPGRLLVSGADDRTLRVWNLDQPGTHRTLKGHQARITALAAGPGNRLLSLSADGSARLWSVDSGIESQMLKWRVEGARSVTFTPDGVTAIAAADDNNLHVWDLRRETERVLEGHSDWVSCVVTTPDGRRAVSGSDDGTLKVWDVTRVAAAAQARDHQDRVRAVAVVPDGLTAISASDDHTLRIWDMTTRTVRQTLQSHHWVFACTPDGSKVVSAHAAGTCRVWDFKSGAEVQSFQRHADRVRCLAVTPCGTRVVSGGDDAAIRVWDLDSGKQTLKIPLVRQSPRALAITPDSRFAITAAEGTSLKLWDLESGAEVRSFRGHDARVNGLAISHNGDLVVSCSDDHTLRVWEAASGRVVRVIEGHDAKVNGLALLPDDRLVVSASDDGDLRVWDVMSGEGVACFTLESPVLTCAVSPLTAEVIAGDRSGLVHFFELAGSAVAGRVRAT